ncbi:metallophosphoesterase family protein [Vannielia sp.]|uniref:metallophosphoesterase family protein n=1 Tax=Vannielia sp. TaxID=2813045 RepID=UPI002619E3B1|nr:metallophosphoesterase family protein [Vannielia sp.]MDF1873695.1 metallophosphoesterase family protein [Vannielia sp.]
MLEPRADLGPPPGRFALIADIHGNADALEAVLAAIDREGIEHIINLGDHLSGPLDPAGTADLLMARPGMLCIRGNHDRYLLTHDIKDMSDTDRVTAEALDSAARGWLRALPATARLADMVFACHAQPTQDDDYLLEHIVDGQLQNRPDDEVRALLGDVDAGLVLCAHSHLPRIREVGGTLIVNPGSVGCPAYADDRPTPHRVETGSPDARWAVVARGREGWEVEPRTTRYSPARMVAMARAYGRKDWAEALATGRMPG